MATKDDDVKVPAPSKAERQLVANKDDLFNQAGRVVIKNDEDSEKATSLLSMIKALYKKAEEERQALTRPLNAVIKMINDRYKKNITGPLQDAEDSVKEKLLHYMSEKRRKAAEEERKLREQQARAEEAGRETRAGNLAVKADLAGERADDAKVARGSFGGTASMRDVWTFRVNDPTKVPREYLIVDERLIRDAVNKGVRDIPGVSIYQEERLAAR